MTTPTAFRFQDPVETPDGKGYVTARVQNSEGVLTDNYEVAVITETAKPEFKARYRSKVVHRIYPSTDIKRL